MYKQNRSHQIEKCVCEIGIRYSIGRLSNEPHNKTHFIQFSALLVPVFATFFAFLSLVQIGSSLIALSANYIHLLVFCLRLCMLDLRIYLSKDEGNGTLIGTKFIVLDHVQWIQMYTQFVNKYNTLN